MNTRQARRAQKYDRPDVLLSLAAIWFGATWILAAGVRSVPLSVHAGVPFLGGLWGKRGNKLDGVRVVKGIRSWDGLISTLGLDWHGFGDT